MIDQAVPSADAQAAEAALRRDLARGDAAATSALPVLRYLVAAEEPALLSEEVLARVRGMLADVAAQLLDALIGKADRRAHAPDEIAVLTRAFLEDPVLLTHVHALALEWQLAERLHERLALDPVVSPLLEAGLAAGDVDARAFVAAQARWSQAQRRLALPLAELPGDVLEAVLGILRALVGAEPALSERALAVETEVRGAHAVGANRLALAARLVGKSEGEGSLTIANAGVALFLSALGLRAGLSREAAILATQPGQKARLALALLAAGASQARLDEQMLALHPASALPQGLAALDGRRAAAILSGGGFA